MKTRIRRVRGIALAAVLVALAIQAAPAGAQACTVTNTYVYMGATFNSVMKTLNGTYVCMYVTGMNASLCAPPATQPRMTVTASAAVGTPMPSCQWTCTGGCGTVTIDNTDGLPVELMEFDVEAAADAEDTAEQEDSDSG